MNATKTARKKADRVCDVRYAGNGRFAIGYTTADAPLSPPSRHETAAGRETYRDGDVAVYEYQTTRETHIDGQYHRPCRRVALVTPGGTYVFTLLVGGDGRVLHSLSNGLTAWDGFGATAEDCGYSWYMGASALSSTYFRFGRQSLAALRAIGVFIPQLDAGRAAGYERQWTAKDAPGSVESRSEYYDLP